MSRCPLLFLVLIIAGCDGTQTKNDAKSAASGEQAKNPATEPAEPAAPKQGLAAPPAEFPKQAKDSLGFDDFWTVLGVELEDGLDEQRVVAILGVPDERIDDGDVTLRYEEGPTITLRASGGVMFDLGSFDEKLKAYAGDPAVSLLGQSCETAKQRLGFMDEVGSYSSCKHYTEDWFLDVTVMCREDLSKVVVVWEPLPAAIKAEPRPADHCN
jgi:hypothetical protein